MKVSFLDLKKNIEPIKSEIAEATHKIINNCNFIMGTELRDFEQNFAKYSIYFNLKCNGTNIIPLNLLEIINNFTNK